MVVVATGQDGCRSTAVLETAAGSGVVTRALAPLLTGAARYVVTDLNPPMLERAARQQPADVRIEWQQADAMALPFEDEVFDVVCCQFGMMFLPDKTTGYSEALRILRDGGRFIFNVWDKIEDNEFAQSVTATATRFFPMTRLFSCSGPHMVFMM
jgi:ubiquinone/menaquinone biosynthesis C-methylase UbiE